MYVQPNLDVKVHWGCIALFCAAVTYIEVDKQLSCMQFQVTCSKWRCHCLKFKFDVVASQGAPG